MQLLEVEAEVLLPVDEFLRAKQLHSLLGRFGVVRVRMMHRDAVEHCDRGKNEGVVERELGVQSMAENDMGQLESKERIEIAGLLQAILGDNRRRIDQALGEKNRIPYSRRFQRLGEHRTAADRTRGGHVVVDQNVVCQRFESLIELAGRINNPSLKQPLHSVILGLLHPFALRSERADIWCVGYVSGPDNRKRRGA